MPLSYCYIKNRVDDYTVVVYLLYPCSTYIVSTKLNIYLYKRKIFWKFWRCNLWLYVEFDHCSILKRFVLAQVIGWIDHHARPMSWFWGGTMLVLKRLDRMLQRTGYCYITLLVICNFRQTASFILWYKPESLLF